MIHFPGIQTILMSSLKVVLQRFIQMSTKFLLSCQLFSLLVNDSLLDVPPSLLTRTQLHLFSSPLQLCIKCLVSMGQMLDILDKHIVLDHILPILEQIPSREPGVLMGMLGKPL